MLRQVNVGHKSLADYHSVVARELIADIRETAAELRGLRVCHISASSLGGGVAEVLYSAVPLLNDIGLTVDWRVMSGRSVPAALAAALRAGLQGGGRPLDDDDRRAFAAYTAHHAADLSADYDIVVVHDPVPMGLRAAAPARDTARWVWRCHLDLSSPDPDALDFLRPHMQGYDLTVFHMAEYIPAGDVPEPVVVPPAIDPLAPKNMSLSADDASYIVNQFGLDVERPLLVQVSRLDPWKDPLGVIDAYRLVKQEVPAVQLALVGSVAGDTPDGADYYDRIVDHAGADRDVFILSNPNSLGGIEVNAFQTQAAAVVHMPVREGFGLPVTEALWKARPVVAANVGGIPLQVLDRETGHLVTSTEQCAERLVRVLRDPETARAMARRGKQHVRHDFLTPRLLRDWLGIFRKLAAT